MPLNWRITWISKGKAKHHFLSKYLDTSSPILGLSLKILNCLLPRIPMPECLPRRPEDRFIPDMVFISLTSFTLHLYNTRKEFRLWNQPFFLNLTGLDVCPEVPVQVPWIPIFASFAVLAVVLLIVFLIYLKIRRICKSLSFLLSVCDIFNYYFFHVKIRLKR